MSLPRTAVVTACALALAAVACSDDPVQPVDVVRPEVTIVEPAEADRVNPRPRFFITFTDQGTGVFCSSVDARIDGDDYSQAFRNGCDEDLGQLEVLAGSPQFNPELDEGGKTLTFTISDHAGNEATERVTFTVVNPAPPSPPPPS